MAADFLISLGCGVNWTNIINLENLDETSGGELATGIPSVVNSGGGVARG